MTRKEKWICLLTLCAAGSLPAASRQPVSFADQLYPVLQKAGCRTCHNPEGVASPTRLHFPEEGAARDRVEAFGKSLVDLVDRKIPANSILLNKPTNRVPHSGGVRIRPGSTEEALLKVLDRVSRVAFRARSRTGTCLQATGSDGRGCSVHITGRIAPAHASAVQQHCARPAAGSERSGRPFSGRGLCQWLQESVPVASLVTGADRSLQRGGRTAGGQRLPPRRLPPPDSLQSQRQQRCGLPSEVHPKFRTQRVSPAARSGRDSAFRDAVPGVRTIFCMARRQ